MWGLASAALSRSMMRIRSIAVGPTVVSTGMRAVLRGMQGTFPETLPQFSLTFGPGTAEIV